MTAQVYWVLHRFQAGLGVCCHNEHDEGCGLDLWPWRHSPCTCMGGIMGRWLLAVR